MKLNNPVILQTRDDIERFLASRFPNIENSRLHQAMNYSLLGGGKRLRPILVRCAALAAGDTSDRWLIPAAAIEMVHVYSLIHDDLPAMDDDDLRRGKATNHKAFDEATAILAGDALQSEAFRLISMAQQLTINQRLKMIELLATAAGSEGMVGGQMLDLLAETQNIELNELKQIHQLKTGALIGSALHLGALCSEHTGEQELSALSQFGEAIGLAFQITDDILDVVATTETLGKTQGSDIAAQKTTYVSLLGVEGATLQAVSLIEQAHAILNATELKFTDSLHEIADYILTREY